MNCPICDAEVYDLEAESCSECQTAFASWEACSVKFHARPLIRCCCCGECPSSGDRACRQCQAHFFKRVPTWLDAEFPGWSTSDEQTAVSTLSCVCCDMEVLPGRAKCEICGFNFHRPTELSAVKHLEMALTHQNKDAFESQSTYQRRGNSRPNRGSYHPAKGQATGRASSQLQNLARKWQHPLRPQCQMVKRPISRLHPRTPLELRLVRPSPRLRDSQ